MVLIAVLISGCASTAPENNYEVTLKEQLVKSAKAQTNFIGRMRMDGRVFEKIYDSMGINYTELWFVTGDGLMSNSNGYVQFRESLNDFCSHKGYQFKIYDIKGNLEVTKINFPNLNTSIFKARDERVFVYECIDGYSQIQFSIALNYGDSDRTAADTIVSKVRVASFENLQGSTSKLFRNHYSHILNQRAVRWVTSY